MGIEMMACRPIKWDEVMLLLIAARSIFCFCEEKMTFMLTVMMLQWHFVGRMDDIMNLTITMVTPSLHHDCYLQLKMRKSKNIRSECDMPMHFFVNGPPGMSHVKSCRLC